MQKSRKRRFDGVGSLQVCLMLSGQNGAGEQRLAILGQTANGLHIFRLVGEDERLARALMAAVRVSAIQSACSHPVF